MHLSRKRLALCGLLAALIPVLLVTLVLGSDHADTPSIASRPGTDLTDVFVFPSPNNANNVVLIMTVNPLIPAGQAPNASFDPNVLYQFKIDNTGDAVEDLVIQTTFQGTGANQIAVVHGPGRPPVTGTVNELLAANPTTGTINTTFQPRAGMTAFCGGREDPFFFDLERFFEILPDRATPINGIPVANPNQPQAASWRPVGQAQDFLRNFNVLAIVVELPKADIGGGQIGVWCTTSM